MGDPALNMSGSMSPQEVELWKAEFAQECLDIFGAPVSIGSCLSKDERYYFSYCTVCLAIAMKEHSYYWMQELKQGIDPLSAAYSFAEYYEREHGENLVPLYKSADEPFDLEGSLK